MFRNYKNSIALAQSRLTYSAGEATAGLVIPFVSFVRPYRAVVDMVKIAKDRLNWDSLDTWICSPVVVVQYFRDCRDTDHSRQHYHHS